MPTGIPYEPEEGAGMLVEQLAGMGFTQADISTFLGITANTLKKHHGGDLKAAYAKLHARLGTKAVSMALAGDKTMLCFVLKTKFGWREKDRAEDAPQETEEEKAARMFQRLKAMEATVVGTPDPKVDPAPAPR